MSDRPRVDVRVLCVVMLLAAAGAVASVPLFDADPWCAAGGWAIAVYVVGRPRAPRRPRRDPDSFVFWCVTALGAIAVLVACL